MTSSWLFPPRTREVQFDEKWSFVAKQQKNCDPTEAADDHKGDWWDHVAYDPEHKLVLAVVPGARVAENAEEVVAEVKDRLGDQPPALMTSDEYPVYETVIESTFSEVVPRASTGPGRRPLSPERRPAPGLRYATVHKEREKGRVVAVPSELRAGKPTGSGPGAEGVGVQPDDQYVVRGASARDGPGPERAEVASDVSVQ
jgi:hypothetical protein